MNDLILCTQAYIDNLIGVRPRRRLSDTSQQHRRVAQPSFALLHRRDVLLR